MELVLVFSAMRIAEESLASGSTVILESSTFFKLNAFSISFCFCSSTEIVSPVSSFTISCIVSKSFSSILFCKLLRVPSCFNSSNVYSFRTSSKESCSLNPKSCLVKKASVSICVNSSFCNLDKELNWFIIHLTKLFHQL